MLKQTTDDKETKIGCIIYAVGPIYEALSICAVQSFKKFHPDIAVHHITRDNVNTFATAKEFDKKYEGEHAIFRWGVALEIWEKYEYDKIIILGADTITCAHLGEFTENDSAAAIVTLNDPYQLTITHIPRDTESGEYLADQPVHSTYTPLFLESEKYGAQLIFESIHGSLGSEILEKSTGATNLDYLHCNTDVVCFNNIECLRAIHDYYFRYMEDFYFSVENYDLLKSNQQSLAPAIRAAVHLGKVCYNEQGPLNLLLTLSLGQRLDENNYEKLFVQHAEMYGYDKLLGYKVKVADSPKPGGHFYNVRSKNCDAAHKVQGAAKELSLSIDWQVCECQSTRRFLVMDKKLYTSGNQQIKVWHYGSSTAAGTDGVNSFIYYKFNQETKDFFKNECDCGDFFQKPFVV